MKGTLMVNRPKAIGTAAETAVVRQLRLGGFGQAERRALTGAYDQGDITGTPGICWEVKAGKAAKTASDGQVVAWLNETETERINARADVGVLVLARGGIGPLNAGQWWAVLPLRDLPRLYVEHGSSGTRNGTPSRLVPVRLHLGHAVALLRAAGYGDEATT